MEKDASEKVTDTVLKAEEVLELYSDAAQQNRLDGYLQTMENSKSSAEEVQKAAAALMTLLQAHAPDPKLPIALQQFFATTLYHLLYTHREVECDPSIGLFFLDQLHAANNRDTPFSCYRRTADICASLILSKCRSFSMASMSSAEPGSP
jgi:hypothetical protein